METKNDLKSILTKISFMPLCCQKLLIYSLHFHQSLAVTLAPQASSCFSKFIFLGLTPLKHLQILEPRFGIVLDSFSVTDQHTIILQTIKTMHVCL